MRPLSGSRPCLCFVESAFSLRMKSSRCCGRSRRTIEAWRFLSVISANCPSGWGRSRRPAASCIRRSDHTPATRWAYIGLADCRSRRGEASGSPPDIGARIRADGSHRRTTHLRASRRSVAPGGSICGGTSGSARRRRRSGSRRAWSAWINLGLVEFAEQNEAGLSHAYDVVRRRAPGLLSDAAEELGVAAWADGYAAPPPQVQAQLLEQRTLAMTCAGTGRQASRPIFIASAFGMIAPIDIDLHRHDSSDFQTCWALPWTSASRREAPPPGTAIDGDGRVVACRTRPRRRDAGS